MLDRAKFRDAVMAMVDNPTSATVQTMYAKQLQHLAEIVAKTYKAHDIEETVQDLCCFSIEKRLHERVNKELDPFSYYWKSLSTHVWAKNKQLSNDIVRSFELNPNLCGDNCEGQEEMLRKLSFDLNEYDDESASSSIEEVLTQTSTITLGKGKRGRPKIREEGEKATHWEYLFKVLRGKKTLTEGALIKLLPEDKRASLKDVSKSIEFYMRQIAKREGVQLSITDVGNETVYMVIE